MSRKKAEKTVTEKRVVLKSGRTKKEVGAWQFYSIYDFCRGFGATRNFANEIANWCRDRAICGEEYSGDGYSIQIVEREVIVC